MSDISTSIISLILIALVFFIIRSMLRNRKNGVCGGGCGDCGSSSICHNKTSFVEEYRKDHM